MDNNLIDVKTAEFAIGKAPQRLTTMGIGSCVVICLYDRVKKMGGLAHIMLPDSSKSITDSNDSDKVNCIGRFVDTALPAIIEKLKTEGVEKENLVAKIVGGAHMFQSLRESSNDLGTRNIKRAVEGLKASGIPLDKEEVGGNVGRSLEFDLETGIVKVITKM